MSDQPSAKLGQSGSAAPAPGGGRLPISCFIIAKNEAARIGRTIDSVREWVDEVLVIDSGSSDRTEEISRSLGATFLFNPWQGYGPQKRFGEDQCRHDWVLNLDADEVVSMALRAEIIAGFEAKRQGVDGFNLYVCDVLPGRDQPLPLARRYNIVRLYNRRKMRYSDSAVHDRVMSEGHPLGQWRGLVLHYSHLSLSQAIAKANYYSDLQAETMKPKPAWQLKLRLLFEFPLYFLRYYIARGYFMGGSQGLAYSMVFASFRFFRIAKMLEKLGK
jgi:glycosyltransferase involved in cell wall biosynthesis